MSDTENSSSAIKGKSQSTANEGKVKLQDLYKSVGIAAVAAASMQLRTKATR